MPEYHDILRATEMIFKPYLLELQHAYEPPEDLVKMEILAQQM
jgi:hypothetical protein